MIGIIDSGIGGRGVEAELKKLLPKVKIIYLGDSENFPYGDKTVKILNHILFERVNELLAQGVKIVVLACNSATVSSIKYLRRRFPKTIFVGVTPAIKVASKETQTGRIAIFATSVTSKSQAQKDLINKYCEFIKVYKVPFKSLASEIEHGEIEAAKNDIAETWQQLANKNIDTIVLGCTHYTLIKKEIQEIVGPNIKLIDSNLAVAKQVQKIYNEISNC
jgi:glutamate racemase